MRTSACRDGRPARVEFDCDLCSETGRISVHILGPVKTYLRRDRMKALIAVATVLFIGWAQVDAAAQ